MITIIKEPDLIAKCPECDCIFKFEPDDTYTATDGSRKGKLINPHKAVRCPYCNKSIKVSKNTVKGHSTHEKDECKDVNPYPKYSYNSGLCYINGEKVFGTDIKWLLWELKHGRNPVFESRDMQ